MIQELTSKEMDKKTFEVFYIDFTTSTIEENPLFDNVPMSRESKSVFLIGPVPMVKNIELTERPIDIDLKKYVADYLMEHVKEVDEIPKFLISNFLEKYKTENHIGLTFEETLKLKVKIRISILSYYIANTGRIGSASNIICNSDMNKKYFIDSRLNDMVVIVNDNLPDDEFYILRNSDIVEPGYKFFYYKENDKLYADIVEIGFFPQHQAAKLVIYK